MKILTGKQIKDADRYIIDNEPIESIDLMERASLEVAKAIFDEAKKHRFLLFLIGKGNNGGDGLAVARMLSERGIECIVYMPSERENISDDCRINLERLPLIVQFVDLEYIKTLPEDVLIIDALLGIGIKGNTSSDLSSLITTINTLPNKVISIDIPSGMKTEFGNRNQVILKADVTVTLQMPKLAMLLPEAGEYCGEIVVRPIGLDVDQNDLFDTSYYYLTDDLIDRFILKRSKFVHKRTFGHALLICGSEGMIGAALLATNAALRSGCGLVTLHLPEKERTAVQVSCPSALLNLDSDVCFSELPSGLQNYTSLGIGPGLGQSPQTITAFKYLLEYFRKPIVIDADALNILASHSDMREIIPSNSILTPHLGELKRLIGEWDDEEHKLTLIKQLAYETQSVIVVKGAFTMICMPDGRCYFNATGNSGMAKGGSGDLLTGFIAGLLARGYSSENAAILGVYIHGLAGDIAAERYGQEGMNSKDIEMCLSDALQSLYVHK